MFIYRIIEYHIHIRLFRFCYHIREGTVWFWMSDGQSVWLKEMWLVLYYIGLWSENKSYIFSANFIDQWKCKCIFSIWGCSSSQTKWNHKVQTFFLLKSSRIKKECFLQWYITRLKQYVAQSDEVHFSWLNSQKSYIVKLCKWWRCNFTKFLIIIIRSSAYKSERVANYVFHATMFLTA